MAAADEPLAEEAADIAARHRLGRTEAVYAAARRLAATLVTLEREQPARAGAVAKARHPGPY